MGSVSVSNIKGSEFKSCWTHKFFGAVKAIIKGFTKMKIDIILFDSPSLDMITSIAISIESVIDLHQ